MGQDTESSTEKIDLYIDSDPYRHKISKGLDAPLLRALCDALDVSVSVLDEDLNYQFIGDGVYKLLNTTTDALSVGDNLSDCHELMMKKGLMTPELFAKNALSANEQKSRAAQDESQLTATIKLANGSIQKFTRKVLPNGLTVSMAHDVSEIYEKDRIIQEALELGNSGYWTYEFATQKYYLSDSLRNYFSQKDQKLIDEKGIILIVHPEDRELFRSALKSLSKTNDKFSVTCRTNTLNGNQRWSTTNGQIIRDSTGKAVRIRAFVKDITRERRQSEELERAKDEAIAASHAKSQFLANMSHEIRTPMNGVLGMAELLANSDINDRQREFVKIINNSASSLLTIINDILDFSKIEAGAFQMDPVPFDLKTSVNDVTAMLSSKAQEKELELIINYPVDAKTKFIGDGGRIRQVVTNLLGNAIKFTTEGHIIIDVQVIERPNNIAFVTINVKDTGIGIDDEKLSQIFNKFTQADNSTTRLYGGTGLGLSISKAIVELMDGRMTAHSELGKGSTFTACIPLKIDIDAVETSLETATLKDKRALIVDDIKVNRALLTEQLASWGIVSDSVKDGAEAVTMLKARNAANQPYDLILMDFCMPHMNGHELAALMSSKPEFAGIPIIMLSSCDQPISSQELKKIGIHNHLVKPVRETKLYDTIVETLSKAAPMDLDIRGAKNNMAQPSPETKTTEILVAEDVNLNQDVVRLMLADTDYQPIFVENGLEAVQLYKKDPARFPLILMDVSMPVMDGHEATRLIKAHEVSQKLPATPIIALTGHALKNDREECLKAGMSDHLSKPVNQSSLLEKIVFWLDAAKQQKAVA